MHAIRIDRNKPLCNEAELGHNRYHPDIAPADHRQRDGDRARNPQRAPTARFTPATTMDRHRRAARPGARSIRWRPVFVKGTRSPATSSRSGAHDIDPQSTAFSASMPGLGFLRDVMTGAVPGAGRPRTPWADIRSTPAYACPGAPFMGVSAVAPSAELLAAWTGGRAAC